MAGRMMSFPVGASAAAAVRCRRMQRGCLLYLPKPRSTDRPSRASHPSAQQLQPGFEPNRLRQPAAAGAALPAPRR